MDETVAWPDGKRLLLVADALHRDARASEDEEDLLLRALQVERGRPESRRHPDPLQADRDGLVPRQRLPVAADVALFASNDPDVVPMRDHAPIMSRANASRSRATAASPASPPSAPRPRLCLSEESAELAEELDRARVRPSQGLDPFEPLEHAPRFLHESTVAPPP
jgi:hypothetical protein